MSARIKAVTVGTVKVGDIIDGYRVTGFGRAWTPADDEHNAGYCQETWNDRVCYAYGERVAGAAVTASAGSSESIRAEIASLEVQRVWGMPTRQYRALGDRIAFLEEKLRAEVEVVA